MRRVGMAAAVLFVISAFFAGVSCTISLGSSGDFQKQFETAYSQLQIAEPSQRQNVQPLVLAHYMSWFQKYGYHWTEGSSNFDPTRILADGRASIASHYYPLTGNYDSADPALIEYQLSLMKMSGIDGVIIDWYGNIEGRDYKPIHEATVALVNLIKKRGLKFVICYEDQSVKGLVEDGTIPRNQAQSEVRGTFNWMAQNWFNDPAYVKVGDRPLLLCFGPQYFYNKAEWDAMWADLNPKPFFIDLDARTNWADGAQNWSPMHRASGGRLTISNLAKYLSEYYKKQEQKPFVVGTVTPAFHDIYAQAGKRSYGYLDYHNGETFKLTWTAAERAKANVIQIQTWNDYGEGTIIEPTIERGYAILEFLQDKRVERDPNFPFNYGDLRIPIELFKIMADEGTSADKKRQVGAIYDLIFAGNAEGTRRAVENARINYDFSVSALLKEPTGENAPPQAFDASGRRNLSFGRLPVASSYIHEWTAVKATDGDITSYWEGAARAWPGTIHVDLGKSEKITTIVLKLNPNRIWQARTQRIEIKTSADGENWVTALPAAEYYFDPVGNQNTVAITLEATGRYVQLVFTANTAATNGQVAELEVYGE